MALPMDASMRSSSSRRSIPNEGVEISGTEERSRVAVSPDDIVQSTLQDAMVLLGAYHILARRADADGPVGPRREGGLVGDLVTARLEVAQLLAIGLLNRPGIPGGSHP